MTDAELQGIAAQAFNMARRQMEQETNFSGLFAVYHHDGGLRRWLMVEQLIVQRMGHDWLNKGHAKTLVFTILRLGVVTTNPEAVVFGSVVNEFPPTSKMRKLSLEKQKELIERVNRDPHLIAAQGFAEMRAALMILAQTADRVCMYTKPLGIEEPASTKMSDQQDFGGRMKLYGFTEEQVLQELGRFGTG
jgi:cyclophilin family peptidyl-prolyl cis-trans isomerase